MFYPACASQARVLYTAGHPYILFRVAVAVLRNVKGLVSFDVWVRWVAEVVSEQAAMR